MSNLPQGFCYLQEKVPTLLLDIRYATNNNFMGRPAAGYLKPVAIGTHQLAAALEIAQKKFLEKGYSIKIFDAYRPQRAVDSFWDWAQDINDTKMKEEYYPTFNNKMDLFNGFIAKLSTHSRGSTVDLTIVDGKKQELDMGTIFDFFGDISATDYPHLPGNVKANRQLLKSVMEECGFTNYHMEWWHYSLNNEPFPLKPEHHFDFVVE